MNEQSRATGPNSQNAARTQNLTRTEEQPVDYHHRTTVNLMAIIAILLVGAGMYLTINYITESRRLERCVGSGRHDCFPVPDPQANTR